LVGANVIETINFQYDAVGKMTLASDTATSLEFTYTDGLLSREKQTLAPSIIAQSDYIYAGGQVREVALSLGASATFDSKVSYTYTANGQVATLQQTGPTTDTKSIRYSHDQAGNRVRTERFSDFGYATPIFETLSSYTNAQGQLKPTVQSIKHQRATGTVLASYDFVWDAGNRLSSMTSSADGLTTYSYTPTNQLSAIDYANAPDQSFTYDLNGNRTGSGNVTGADNRLTSNATWDFVYDANGNMTRRTLKSDNSYIEYTYDHRDRLTDVRYRNSAGTLTKRVHFGYDALNRRYLQTVENGSGTILSTVYYVNQGFRKDRGDAGDEIALRLDGTGAVISRYLHGSMVDEVLAEENIGSGGVRDVLWAMTDHQGSVRDLARVTSGTASVVNHIVYDAFGKTVSETDAAIAHLYGYTGRELDKETGLQYNRARYLDLVLARWISQDPIGFAAGDANLYRYVGNKPTMATDPSGLQEPGAGKSPILIPLSEDEDSPSANLSTIEILWPKPKGFGIRDGHTFPMFDRYFFDQDPYGFFFKYGYIPEPHNVRGPYLSDSEKLIRKQRERLTNIRSLIQEMIRVGDCLAEREGKYSGYDLSGLDLSKFRKDDWSVLRDHMQYALNNHRDIGWFDVRIVNGSSYNIPVIPGINLDSESFFGEDGGAVHVFVHEPMHNLSREGLYHDFGYFNGRSISEIVGPYSSSNYMERFIFMLQRARTDSGESVWQSMRRQSRWESKCK
jgi:RHS repeat-associated protein